MIESCSDAAELTQLHAVRAFWKKFTLLYAQTAVSGSARLSTLFQRGASRSALAGSWPRHVIVQHISALDVPRLFRNDPSSSHCSRRASW